jgi:amino acid transporter
MSCALPIALGLLAYKKTWTQMGPWDLGAWFPVFAVLSILGVVLIFLIGIQPPNDKALWITVGVLIVTAVIWYGFERKRFKGPPIGEAIARRQAVIREAERAVGEIK